MKERYSNVTVTLQKISKKISKTMKFNYLHRKNFLYSKEFENGHTSLFERMNIVSLFNQLELGCRNKYKVVSELAKNNFWIIILAQTVKRYVDR